LGSAGYNADVDVGDIAESARDEALTFLDTMESIQQGLVNMVAAGLWHAVEQKLLLLHRRELLELNEQENPEHWKLKEVEARLREAGIDIKSFASPCRHRDQKPAEVLACVVGGRVKSRDGSLVD
jgi:hypothetical protein